MTAIIRPNPNNVNFELTREALKNNPKEVGEYLTTLVIANVINMYLPFNPTVEGMVFRETGVTHYRADNPNWDNDMLVRANAKMKELFPSIATAKKLPDAKKAKYASWLRDVRNRIEATEPLVMQVVHNQNLMNKLPIKDINHVILGFLVRYTRKSDEGSVKETKV